MATELTTRKLSINAAARRLGVGRNKLREFVLAGREENGKRIFLRATNVASSSSRWPRWKISEEDLAEFERQLEVVRHEPKPRVRRRKQAKGKFY